MCIYFVAIYQTFVSLFDIVNIVYFHNQPKVSRLLHLFYHYMPISTSCIDSLIDFL